MFVRGPILNKNTLIDFVQTNLHATGFVIIVKIGAIYNTGVGI